MFLPFMRAAPPAAATGYPAKLADILALVSQFGYIKLYFFRTHWYAQNWNSKLQVVPAMFGYWNRKRCFLLLFFA